MATIVATRQWTKDRISALSDLQLALMDFDEMVEIVLASGVPVRNSERIHTIESDTLVRLVHWARQFCRGQTI